MSQNLYSQNFLKTYLFLNLEPFSHDQNDIPHKNRFGFEEAMQV